MPHRRKEILNSVRKVVIKVGSAVLTDRNGKLNQRHLTSICDQVHALRERGYTVVLVSSGAIGAGMGELGLKQRPKTLPLLQAAAAIGQSRLVSLYDDAFEKHGFHAAQMLLTRDDFADRTRYVNAKNTLWSLLEYGAVPIINENDTIAIEEIRFGDNDVISALVTHLLQADLLVLLTVVDGLLETNGRKGETGKVIDIVENINSEITQHVTSDRSHHGSGGMQSKLEAVRKTLEVGQPVIIAHGRRKNVLLDIVEGRKVGTLFLPAPNRMKGWKRWVGFAARPRGHVRVDDGAKAALIERGKSLLASGVTEVRGSFRKGDVIIIEGLRGRPFARGLTNYSSEDLDRIKGLKSSEFGKVLPYQTVQEVIHRNNLVLVQ